MLIISENNLESKCKQKSQVKAGSRPEILTNDETKTAKLRKRTLIDRLS